jgi:hypothetical protein
MICDVRREVEIGGGMNACEEVGREEEVGRVLMSGAIWLYESSTGMV